MKIFSRWNANRNPVSKEKAFERLSDEHAAYIRDLVEKAGNADFKREVFGAESHQYRLNPVLPIGIIKEYEVIYHVKFPEEYVFFLTKVGNGGAGPYYGLYPLEKLEMYNEYAKVSGNNAWIDAALTKDDWAYRMNLLDEADDETYERLMEEACGGFHVIGTQGCTYDNLLMNSGSEKGKIAYFDWNLEPENVPYLTGLTFLEWYEKYFLEILEKRSVTSYGYVRLGTEEELISAFRNAERQEKQAILRSFYRFHQVSRNTINFLTDIDDKELDAMRTELLFRFDADKGIKLFEAMINGANQKGAVLCAKRMPEEYYDRFYEKMLALLYGLEVPYEELSYGSYKQKILYFLQDCKSLRAKELVDFATDESNVEDERKTAIFVMGRAGDKMDCLEHFIHFMKSDSYWIAHTALQAMAGTKSDKLLETYEWMWNRYKEDKTMAANLEIAFQTNGIKKQLIK